LKIKLYDGFNYFRMVVEKDLTSLAPRRLYQDMLQAPDYLHLWVWDGRGARAARQEIFPAYKTKRKPPTDDIRDSIQYFREMLINTTAYSVEVPGYEGDDVIAALTDHYIKLGAKGVEIYSNDFDLAQLQALSPVVVGGWRPKEGIAPHEVQTYKTFCGDPSDTIPGIKGFGQKAWEASDKKVLRAIALAALQQKSIEELVPHIFLEPVRGEQQLKTRILESAEDIAAMWVITGFLPVPQGHLVQYMQRPLHDPAKVEQHLKRFLL
jgi:hypothetical protein